MSQVLPIHLLYNLNRLGQAGDEILFAANETERAALAGFAGVLEVPKFDARITLTKVSPVRFRVSYVLAAEVVQACVVTLEPLTGPIARTFERDLHFSAPLRRGAEKPVAAGPDEDDIREEIESLHYDLAGPLAEELILAIDPYPRSAGVEFHAPQDGLEGPENPFKALKNLKSSGESNR